VLVSLWAFASERAQYGEPWEHTRPLELEGMRWAADHTPPGAILVDRRFATDLAVRARRSVISGGERWEHLWSYPAGATATRRAMTVEMGALSPASPATRELIRGLARPVFVAVRRRWEEDWEQRLAADHPGYDLVYRNPDIAFFRWREGAP
jgi:hypothetical protein